MLKLVSCVLGEPAVWRLGVRHLASAASAAPARADKAETPATSAADTENAAGPPKSGLVAAAFASLNTPEAEEELSKTTNQQPTKPNSKSFKPNRLQQLDTLITNASDLNTLLSVGEQPVISRKHAFKVVSVLSQWSSSHKVKIEQFETDARFLRLCRVLARSRDAAGVSALGRADDLSTVLSVTGDDEAARLAADLTLPQMIKVMSTLTARGRRSKPLLHTLATHIASQPVTLDVKQAADLLYAMSTLNFPDEPLLEKICDDLVTSLPHTTLSAGVHSALVSLGLLRYRSPAALDALSGWVARQEGPRAKDVQAALLSLASLSHTAPHTDKLIEMALALKEEDLPKPSMWLELVWALLLVGHATPGHLRAVLAPAFVEKLYVRGELPVSVRRKLQLLHAHGALAGDASLCLPEDARVGPSPLYNRDKQLFVSALHDTLRSLLASDAFLKTDCDSGAGFLYDAELAVDAKGNPVPLSKAASDKSATRIAILAIDYHDMCRRTSEPTGVFLLYSRLLNMQGFRVMLVPYTEFCPKDKLLTRVQYIERRIKEFRSDST